MTTLPYSAGLGIRFLTPKVWARTTDAATSDSAAYRIALDFMVLSNPVEGRGPFVE